MYNDFEESRVGCLYRVSTKKQVSDKDDIPMQKQACTEFAESKGWIITKEFLEKGVSGYKLTSNERDVLQDLKESALRREFDVLLVFMFDRLGRRDDETPFIVEWFDKQGIEVWSVKEGQQTFEKDNPYSSPYGDVIMNSACHAWSCTPSYFIRKYEYIR
ncbi:MAG: recombinase family protein [Candidatus Ornithomonoglobus sp.]